MFRPGQSRYPGWSVHMGKISSSVTEISVTGPGARFSKVPVTSGPDNLSGPLSGNFIGSDVAFLEAPVNFAGNFRAR